MLKILKIIVREIYTYPQMIRRPEPSAAMEENSNVMAFHSEGGPTGALRPIYYFNALAMSRLLPPRATMIDLGCGSGQYLRFLADCRRDIRIIGVDLSEEMIRVGNGAIEDAGLKERVTLCIGDMTQFQRQIPNSVALISSVFSLHHLQTMENLRRCLTQITTVASDAPCAAWLFDHARPRNTRTAEEFPAIFTPHAAPAFQDDSRNSLRAAFTFKELSQLLDRNSPVAWNHARSKLLRLYQAHWIVGPAARLHSGHNLFITPALTPEAREQYRQLRRILRVPLVDGQD